MSEEEADTAPRVCEAFEPQAWRKGICKNCFQPPERHAVTANGDASSASACDTASESRGKGATATSIKDKYEQLERDKYKQSSPPKTLPRSKGQGNIAAFNENYGSLDRKTGRVPESPSGNIPPPVFPKQYKNDGDSNLKKSKFGSVENVNSTEADSTTGSGLKSKTKFGSMENIADKKKDSMHIPIQKGKFGGSSENISGKDKLKAGSPLKEKESELLNKLDSFQNELKSGVSSKSGPTVIHKQKDGNVDVLNLPPKDAKKDNMDNKLKSRFEKPELKSQGDEQKLPGKLGVKSKFDLKSPTTESSNDLRSLKDSLSKAADKKLVNSTESKVNSNESKGLLPKSKDQLKSSGADKSQTEQKTGRFNFKDQLKSTSPEKTPSSLKDRLKSPPIETEKKGDVLSWKDKLKAKEVKSPERGIKDNNLSDKNKLTDRLKSPPSSDKGKPLDKLKTPVLDDKKAGFSLKDKLKSPSAEKAKPFDNKVETDKSKGFSLKDQLKSVRDKDGSPTKTPSVVEDTKTKGYNRDQLLKSSAKKQEVETLKSPAVEEKNKVPNFKDQLKSSKSDKESKSRAEKDSGIDLPVTGKSFDLRSALKKPSDKEKDKKEKEPDVKTDGKAKFEIPSLKSSKDEVETSVKSKPGDSSQEKPNDLHTESTDKKHSTNNSEIKTDSVCSKAGASNDIIATDTFQKDVSKTDAATFDDKTSVNDVQKENKGVTENRRTESSVEGTDSAKDIPQMSDISKNNNFEHISVDTGDVSGDLGGACAATRPRDRSSMHVDTQVFTSSRNKAAGVNCLTDTDSLESASSKQKGFSGLDKSSYKSLSKETDAEGIQNGDISNKSSDKMVDSFESCPKPSVVYSSEEIEKLKAELINMTERCHNLETENEMLSSTLKKKDASENTLRKQKDEVENSIRSLQNQLKTMEEKCSKLELDRTEQSQSTRSGSEKTRKSEEKETEDTDEKLSVREKIMEDMMDENEQLKQEINELKAEMEEMYDSFRDQEAEEFRELQKELEYTAKNCRVLQFKLRKMERKNEQVEQDKAQFEERLRKLQNQFQDRDAVSHIHSLEDELRVCVFGTFIV